LAHTRRRKRPEVVVPLGLRKLDTHEFKSKRGLFEVDEYRDFWVVKKKLSKRFQKGKKKYDPIALVVAKKDETLPIFPDKEFAKTFGFHLPYFVSFIGRDGKGGIYEQLRSMRKGEDVFSIPLTRGFSEFVPHDVELGSSEIADRLEKLFPSTKKEKR
jgi:hypothetical protein